MLIAFTLSCFQFFSQTVAAENKLGCEVTAHTLAPHLRRSTGPIEQSTYTAVNDWKECYKIAREQSAKWGYAVEDHAPLSGAVDIFSGPVGPIVTIGYIYYFVKWRVNDSRMGYWNGSQGLVNPYSPEEPAIGDQRHSPDGQRF